MSNSLCITLRFLRPECHARGDGGEPEWPPSPLRLFQALMAAAAAKWNERERLNTSSRTLKWLEALPPPIIIAARGEPAQSKYRLYVPNNTGDKVASIWTRGGEANIADSRTEKDVRPTRLTTGDAVHYVFAGAAGEEAKPHFELIRGVARSVSHLGWGVDMVVGNCELLSDSEVAGLQGEKWHPVVGDDSKSLRVPTAGTLDALTSKHRAFLARLNSDGFAPVPPLSKFNVVGYRRSTEPARRQFAAFSILKSDASGMQAFDTCRRTREVAGMVRHAVCEIAKSMRPFGWGDADINQFVHGKTADGLPASGPDSPDRFLYLPLPTINSGLGRVEAIRRVLIAAPPNCKREIEWVRRALSGQDLKSDDGEARGILTMAPNSDWVVKKYIEPSKSWTTVTPVILPGHDDRNEAKAFKLIRQALEQSGLHPQLVSQIEIDWRRVGFLPGVDLANKYLPPKNLEHRTRYHVRLKFPNAIAGPIVMGSGRFRGFGLFVHSND